MHSAFVSIVAQQQLLSQSGRHCRFEIAAAILIGIAAAITPQTSLSSLYRYISSFLAVKLKGSPAFQCYTAERFAGSEMLRQQI